MTRDDCNNAVPDDPVQSLVLVSNAPLDGDLGLPPSQESELLQSPLDAAFRSSQLDDPLVASGFAGLAIVECAAGFGAQCLRASRKLTGSWRVLRRW